jgi:hypothetical protein
MRDKVLGFGWPFRPQWSSNSTRKPRAFDWTDKAEEATVDTVVCISRAIETEIDRPGRKLAWLLESPAIARYQNTTPFIEQNLDRVMDAYEWVLTPDRAFCALHPRIVYHPAGANLPWIDEHQYAIYRKTRMCSMFASAKEMVEPHRTRQRYAEKFRTKLDLFGGACGSPRIGGGAAHPDKSDGMIPYRFQLVMENCRVDFYYTEKITDCFATGTVPVYWGSSCIGEIFDTDGILTLDEDFDPDGLSEGLYWSMMPAIRNNLEIVRQLEGTDDLLYRKFIQPSRFVAAAPLEDGEEMVLPQKKHLEIVTETRKTNVDDLAGVPQGMASVHPVTSKLERPRTAYPEQEPDEWFEDIRETFLLRVPDAYIGDNVIFDRERYYSFKRWWAGPNWSIYGETKRVEHIDRGMLVSAWGGRAFQHFILDALPALAAVIDRLESPEFEDVFIASHVHPSEFTGWFWNHLGLSHRVIEKPRNAQEGRVIHANTAFFWYFQPGIGDLGLYPRGVLRPLQQRLGLLDAGAADRVLYLGRPNHDRSVLNQESVVRALKRELSGSGLVFQAYESRRDWREDMETYRRARIIIGPHGGALANMAFARPGTHVIEFTAPMRLQGDNRHLLYYGLAQAAGHHHWFVQPADFGLDKMEMTVDEGEVVAVLRRVLDSIGPA